MEQTQFQIIKERYNQAEKAKKPYLNNCNEISKYVGIQVDYSALNGQTPPDEGKALDNYTNDPTAALSVVQSAEYTKGIVWGSGEGVFNIVPSDELEDVTADGATKDWFAYVSKIVLNQMNHSQAGLNSALTCHFYDQQSYGTSGVGAFPNNNYENDGNAIVFKPYGVDSIAIEEGKNGLIEYVYNTQKYRVSKLIREYCYNEDGELNEKILKKFPEEIQKAYADNQMNKEFTIIQAIVPNEEFKKGKKGKIGAPYVGYFFTDKSTDFFHEEYYMKRPVLVSRAVKIRNQVWGRASGTMLISTIRCINFIVGTVLDILEKMSDPAIGIANGALFGDDAIDTSAHALNVLNGDLLKGGITPVIPMHTIGDPTPMITFLLPYLNEKVATAFKIDLLLDMSAKSDMTATESMQRFSIRGRALSGFITQQKIELVEPLIERCIQICQDQNLLGYKDNEINTERKERYDALVKLGRKAKIIPPEVVKMMESGKQWYKIQYNNDLNKLAQSDKIDSILKTIQGAQMIGQVFPDIYSAIKWFTSLKDMANALGCEDIIMSESEFKAEMQKIQAGRQAQAQRQAEAQQAQIANTQAATVKTLSAPQQGGSNATTR